MLKRGKINLAGCLIGLSVCVLLALMSRKVIDHVPLYDELLHFLSARGLLSTGQPVIADGLYSRAALFTRIVAFSLDHFGSTPVAARLPALFFQMVLFVLLAMWVTRRVGLLGGFTAALVLCLQPTTIELAVFARFYTLHALVITALGIILYEVSTADRSLRFRLIGGVAALLLTGVGLHLQETTIIAFGAFAAGVAAVLACDHWSYVAGFCRRYPLQIAGGVVLLVVGVAGAAFFLGLIQRLGEAPLWAMHSAHRPFYYLVTFAQSTPFLWPVFPLIAVAAFLTHQRLTLFCLIALAITVVMHSIAAQKSLRYIYYVMPFLCIVWGAAIDGMFRYLRSIGTDVGSRRKLHPVAILALIGVPLLFSLEGQRAVKLALGRLTPLEALGYAVEAEWSSAVPVLQPLAGAADRIVTSNAMKSIYYLGRYDYELNASIVTETDTTLEFGRDERTGRPAIGTAESTRKVLDMPGKTLVVLEQETMNLDSGVSAAAGAEIVSRCTAVALPAEAALSAWECTHR